MRQVTRDACTAFMQGTPFKRSNTKVVVGDGIVSMYLFGNKISERSEHGSGFRITMAGWGTPTTRERLSGLPGVRISQHKYDQYLNGEEIRENEWYEIN